MKRPIIAITLDYCEDSPELKYSNRPWYALRCDYSAAVAKFGGMPIFISYEHHLIDDVLALADGLLIPGGDLDIHPKFYGQKVSSPKVRPNEVRCRYEIDLIKKALKHRMPFFGICNGMQILNVAFGGDLIQDIESGNHLVCPRNLPAHSIEIIKGTNLEKIVGGKNNWIVNSSHHQALNRLGEGLVVSAKADDGVIEAIELKGHPFAIGVEWHPEYLNHELDSNLFKEFIRAAAARI